MWCNSIVERLDDVLEWSAVDKSSPSRCSSAGLRRKRTKRDLQRKGKLGSGHREASGEAKARGAGVVSMLIPRGLSAGVLV